MEPRLVGVGEDVEVGWGRLCRIGEVLMCEQDEGDASVLPHRTTPRPPLRMMGVLMCEQDEGDASVLPHRTTPRPPLRMMGVLKGIYNIPTLESPYEMGSWLGPQSWIGPQLVLERSRCVPSGDQRSTDPEPPAPFKLAGVIVGTNEASFCPVAQS
jgi:hypothetical protein